MNNQQKAEKIVQLMMSDDELSQWLGIKILDIKPGYCKISMTVRPEMVNGFGIAHGGISYSLADSALAFSSNSHGAKSMSIETSISHHEPIRVDDVITAEAKEIKIKRSVGWYDIMVTNQDDDIVANFKGTVYRTNKMWNPT